jgi:hypothetical protein
VADILPSAVKMIAAPAVSSGEIDQLPANAGRAGHPRAAMVAYVDDFKMTMLFVLGSIPLLPMRDPRDRTPPAAAVTPRRPAKAAIRSARRHAGSFVAKPENGQSEFP